MSLKYILQPVTIASCTVPNRVVFPAHTTNFGRGTLSDDWIAYHEARPHCGHSQPWNGCPAGDSA